jgi:hypothetical protein
VVCAGAATTREKQAATKVARRRCETLRVRRLDYRFPGGCGRAALEKSFGMVLTRDDQGGTKVLCYLRVNAIFEFSQIRHYAIKRRCLSDVRLDRNFCSEGHKSPRHPNSRRTTGRTYVAKT